MAELLKGFLSSFEKRIDKKLERVVEDVRRESGVVSKTGAVRKKVSGEKV